MVSPHSAQVRPVWRATFQLLMPILLSLKRPKEFSLLGILQKGVCL